MSEKRKARSYTREFIQEAVRLVLEEKMVVSKAAQDLGIPDNTLHGWVGRVKKGYWKFDDLATPAKLPTRAAKYDL